MVLLLLVVVSACNTPRSGPSRNEIIIGDVEKGGNAYIVDVDQRVTELTKDEPVFEFPQNFIKASPLDLDKLYPGDIISLRIFENVREEPLLGNKGQRVAFIDEIQVDESGNIFVPYVGLVAIKGMSPNDLREYIVSKLSPQTPDPQVSLVRVAGKNASVSVQGFVVKGGVYQIEPSTNRLSSMIARSGGVNIPPSSAIIRVTRGNQSGRVRLDQLYNDPKNDIALRLGDRIVVERDGRSYIVFGSVGKQIKVLFESSNVSILDALATVGGLNTSLADPEGVFIFRDEPASIANKVLGKNNLKGPQRMIYVIDLTKPNGVFDAKSFMVKDGDALYVPEALNVGAQKALSLLTGATSGASGSLSLFNAVP